MDSVVSWVCLTIFGLAAVVSFLREVIKYELDKQAASEAEYERLAQLLREENYKEFNKEYYENLGRRNRCLF